MKPVVALRGGGLVDVGLHTLADEVLAALLAGAAAARVDTSIWCVEALVHTPMLLCYRYSH